MPNNAPSTPDQDLLLEELVKTGRYAFGVAILVNRHGWPTVRCAFSAGLDGPLLSEQAVDRLWVPLWTLPEFVDLCETVKKASVGSG